MFVETLLILIFVSFWAGLYLILKQQGRILLRMDELSAAPAPAPVQAEGTVGLPIGAEFPEFQFKDLNGRETALSDFRGKQVLLVNWNPDCGFCELVAPDLARIKPSTKDFQVLLLAHGDAEANRKLAGEQNLECPVLLVTSGQVPKAFESMGTPVAYLLDGEGRIAQPLAIGSDAIPELIRLYVPSSAKDLPGKQSLAESRIVRDGLKAGTTAPSFTLPDVNGRMVSLEDFRRKRLLLVFSDPHCGPCDELAPQLASLHRAHATNGLGFVMVGRGDAGENRTKAEQHRIEFPVVLQEKWKLSKEYGIFSTPVAFLIGEDGVIQKNVAVGVDAIKTLAHDALKH